MGSWEDAEGKRQTALNVTQRKLDSMCPTIRSVWTW